YNLELVASRTYKHNHLRMVNAREYIAAGEELLTYNLERWSNAAAIAGVCALTGRRPFEVGCIGHFAPDPERARRIDFSGQAKTRDTERANAVYSIPVLGDRQLVLDTVAQLRNRIDPNMKNSRFSQRYAKEYGRKATETFHDIDGEPIIPRYL
ncbi:protelomerase family protein, partial [Nocardia cyriacigeorgica]|uniref:protelomerase family protein n=1 Tax=Nocardia cyriacigeorgica TaxID=135487 RepID=UPI001E52B398